MNHEFISKRTRNEFREYLVGWILHDIEVEFEGANIECDRSYEPQVSGQRRSLVERFYRTLDFTNPADVRRILVAYAAIIERAERNLSELFEPENAERSIAQLKACLAKDGLAYSNASIMATTPEARVIFEALRSITEITRRAIFDELTVSQFCWYGRLSETGFLDRLYNLSKLPSHDRRFDSMSGDICQHRENNHDWEDDWLFTDSRLELQSGTDAVFLRFLCETVHPAVRPDSQEAKFFVAKFNKHLVADGWEIVEGKLISGRPTFISHRRASGAVALPESMHATDVLSDDYVRELSGKCDSRLASCDLDGAVTVARTLLEAILSELEVRLAGTRGDHKGDLPRQFKQPDHGLLRRAGGARPRDAESDTDRTHRSQ